jgi:hypothetical protein
MSELIPMKRLPSAARIAVFLASAGCGGNEFAAGSPDAASSGVTADQACSDSAHLRCEQIKKCSQAEVIDTYGSEGACETQLKLNCINSLAAPNTGSTPETVEACANAYPSVSCDALLDDQPPTACLQATGTRASGQQCGSPGQCQTGFCAIVPGSLCGTCAPVPQRGDSCAVLTTCGQLLFCDSTNQICTGFAAQGSQCNKTQPCGAGLSCVGATTTTFGTCQPAVETAGATCDPQTKTGAGCDRNQLLTCNSVSKQCESVQLVGAGQSCGTVNDQAVICSGAGTCVAVDAGAPDGGTSEICVAAASDGGPCDLVQGPFCLNPERCVLTTASATAGVCQFSDPSQCQ